MSVLDWYWTEVKGNVLSILPAALAAGAWLRIKHQALMEAHRANSRRLESIILHLDPEAETDGMLDRIHALVDETQPGGVTAVIEEVRKRDASQ